MTRARSLPDYDRLTRGLAKVLRTTPDALEAALVPAKESDLDEVLMFRKTLLEPDVLTWDDRDYVRWRYLDEAIGPKGRCLLMLRHKGEVVGLLGLEPTLVYAKPAALVEVMKCFDSMVSPALNGMGLGAWMALAAIRRYSVIVAQSSNAASKTLVQTLFPRIHHRMVWKKLLRAGPVVESRLPFPRLVRPVSAALNVPLAIERKLRLRKLNATLVRLDRFDDDVDQLMKARAAAGGAIFERSALRLNWRFMNNPRRRYRAFGLREDGRLTAYAILTNTRGKNREVFVVDWLTDASAHGGMANELLWAGIIRRAVADRASTLTAWTTDLPTVDSLRRLGFLRRGDTHGGIGVNLGSTEQAALLRSQRSWFATQGDSDGD